MPAKNIRHQMQHAPLQSRSSPPGAVCPRGVWQMTMSELVASATAARTALKLAMRLHSAIASAAISAVTRRSNGLLAKRLCTIEPGVEHSKTRTW